MLRSEGAKPPQAKLHLGLYAPINAPLLGQNVCPSEIFFSVGQYDHDQNKCYDQIISLNLEKCIFITKFRKYFLAFKMC